MVSIRLSETTPCAPDSCVHDSSKTCIDQFKHDAVTPEQVRRLELDANGKLRVQVDNPIKPTAGGWSAPSDEGFEAIAVGALRELRNEGTLIDLVQAAEIRALKQELAELRNLIQSQRTGDR